MKTRTFVTGAALAVTLVVGASPATAEVYRGAEELETVYPQSTVAARDLPASRQWQPGDPIREIPRRVWSTPMIVPEPGPHGDPLLEAYGDGSGRGVDSPMAFNPPEVNVTVAGAGMVSPPDPNGDVGPNHVVVSKNAGDGMSGTDVFILNKMGAALQPPFAMRDLAPNGTDCNTTASGDPIILYDRQSDRWILTEFTTMENNMLCIYVSQTADPTGAYHFYAVAASSFPDYPHYGIIGNGLYIGANQSDGSGNTFVYALDRAAMVAGNPIVPQSKTLPQLAGFGFQLISPADSDGPAAAPAGTPGIFVRHRDDEIHNVGSNDAGADFIEIWELQPDFNNAANTTLTGPMNIQVAEFDSTLCGNISFTCIPQPGTKQLLDPLREPIMNRPTYRNQGTHQSLTLVQSIDVNGMDQSAIRWYEVRKTGGGAWALQDQGTFGNGSPGRWMPAIAMDAGGNIATAYSVSDDTSVFPGLRYAGRMASSPAGTLPLGEHTIQNGGAAQTDIERWGDYHSMSVDPSNDCSFYHVGMFIPGGGTGSTPQIQLSKFTIDPNCAAGSGGPGTDTVGIYAPNTGAFFLRNAHANGPADETYFFGPGGQGLVELSGDWNGDGMDTVGLYAPNTGAFFLRNAHANGPADETFFFGPGGTGLIPIVGDWNGNNTDTVGLYNPTNGAIFLRNAHANGPADVTFFFGPGGLTAITGDWDGDGDDTIGLYDPSNGTFFLRNTNTNGPADATFFFGAGTLIPLTGDWNGNTFDSIGLYDTSSGAHFLRNANSSGPADETFFFGPGGHNSVTGDWDNL